MKRYFLSFHSALRTSAVKPALRAVCRLLLFFNSQFFQIGLYFGKFSCTGNEIVSFLEVNDKLIRTFIWILLSKACSIFSLFFIGSAVDYSFSFFLFHSFSSLIKNKEGK